MKHLLNGVAIVAALAFATPVWAQTNPSSSPPPTAAPAPTAAAPKPAAPKAAAKPAPMKKSTSATAPKRRPVRHVAHRVMPHRATKQAPGNIANQLNAQELQRLQAGQPPTK